MATMAERHLAQAEQGIAEAEGRVTRQRLLIDGLATGGHDTAEAEGLLAALLVSLDQMHAHRATILAEIAQERGGEPS